MGGIHLKTGVGERVREAFGIEKDLKNEISG
jgi:tRNA(Ser,Leu) C12 N-acetylase TAN1